MTFREDGEGIHDRAERLDHDLETAQKALHGARERRLEHLEHEMADAQERLNRMNLALRALRDDQAPPRPSPLAQFAKAMPVLLPVGMVAMLGFAIGHSSARRHHAGFPLSKKSALVTNAKMTGSASTRGSSIGGTTESTARIRWSAKVRKATGIELKTGATCRIEGRFNSRGALLATSNVEVWCDDKLVYDKGVYSGPDAVVSVDEYATDSGAFVYNLDVEDVRRPGFDRRAMASIDTDAHVAVISRDVGEPFRLELDVEPVAAPIASSGPLFNIPRAASAAPHARIARTARVVETSGKAPVASGDRCTVEVVPATPRSGWSCRAFVRCGDKAVYGEQRTGYADCSGSDDSIQVRDLGFSLEDGDPKLEADLGRGTLTLHEDDTSTWSAQLKID